MVFIEKIENKAYDQEIWQDIEGYEGLYQVSTYGRVRSLNYNHTGETRILKAVKHTDGYLQIHLCKDGKVKNFKVHRLVAQTFIYCENRENLEINHIDEDKTNNRVNNLEWCTRAYNNIYGTRIQRVVEKKRGVYNTKKSKSVKQLTLMGELIKTWPSSAEAGRNGFDQSAVAACCNGKRKSHKGYRWQYASKF